MPNVLIVTLDDEIHPTCLSVADKKSNPKQVKRAPDWQTIRWLLQIKDPNASFNLQTDPEPGFAWVGMNRPAGVFSEPVLRKQRKELTIADLNDNNYSDDSENTTGEWIYQLSVTINNVTYQTKTKTGTKTKLETEDGRTTTNPRIKNT